MLPLGWQASQKLALHVWGFSHLGRQTERERIPRPRLMFTARTHRLSGHGAASDTQEPRLKFPASLSFFADIVLDADAPRPVARNSS